MYGVLDDHICLIFLCGLFDFQVSCIRTVRASQGVMNVGDVTCVTPGHVVL